MTKFKAVIHIHYFDTVHTFLNVRTSLGVHAKNSVTSPLSKSVEFYLAQKRI